MAFSVIQFDVTAGFAVFAPLMELVVEGNTVATVVVDDETHTISFEFTGPTRPTSLLLRFVNDGAEMGRTITII